MNIVGVRLSVRTREKSRSRPQTAPLDISKCRDDSTAQPMLKIYPRTQMGVRRQEEEFQGSLGVLESIPGVTRWKAEYTLDRSESIAGFENIVFEK
ncbi:hypothetical protein SRHO_G00207130 [Serrasalmus rhombeus]